MGFFGKSFEDKVAMAVEIVKKKFPSARIAVRIDGEVVTLTGEAPNMFTKKAIIVSFNELVETENTFNKITIPAPVADESRPRGASPAGETTEITSGRYYEVIPGDTLSAIAKKYYGSANKYMKIFEANRDTLNDPNLIKVGQRLRIPE